MNTQIVAVLITEGSKLIGQWFRNRPIEIKASRTVEAPISPEIPKQPSLILAEKATETATGCLPCSLGHMSSCSGLLNEAVRFAKSDGIDSNEVIDRVGMCLDELNAMERVDLRPEMIVSLPAWEKDLADEVLVASRAMRHTLEELGTVDNLEQAAASTQSTRTHIWRQWIKNKMKHLTPEEQAKIQQRVTEKLEELEETDND